jgi:nucleotide-binding universal stress UspA family protein
MIPNTTILVPLDGSALAKHALRYARALVGVSGSITLLQVLRTPEPIRDAAGIEIVPAEIAREWTAKAAHEYLEKTADHLRSSFSSPITVDTVISTGDIAEEILNTATKTHATSIVMSSHARGAVGRAAFGSVADRVARTATIPVVIVNPDQNVTGQDIPSLRRLIVPLDGSERSRGALGVAQSLAQHLSASLYLVHVIDTFSSYMAVSGMPVSPSLVEEWYAEARRELDDAVRSVSNQGVTVTSDIFQGNTVQNLCDIARPGDLIVMTSHGRSGFTRWLLGSVAEKLVRVAPVPVCLVPARGPVQSETAATAARGTALV